MRIRDQLIVDYDDERKQHQASRYAILIYTSSYTSTQYAIIISHSQTQWQRRPRLLGPIHFRREHVLHSQVAALRDRPRSVDDDMIPRDSKCHSVPSMLRTRARVSGEEKGALDVVSTNTTNPCVCDTTGHHQKRIYSNRHHTVCESGRS